MRRARTSAGLVRRTVRIGVEEVSLEPTTADAGLILNAPPFEMQWRPEFDVTAAYNPRSVLVPVARIEGLTGRCWHPRSAEGGTFLAGQGAAVTLDGRYDAVLTGSRSLFINLGGNTNAIRTAAGPASGCCSIKRSAKRALRALTTSTCCCIRRARGARELSVAADASSSASLVRPRSVALLRSRNATGSSR